MEGVHSYEQRSISELSFEQDSKQNRVIIANRKEPKVDWSTNNQLPSPSDTSFRWKSLVHLLSCGLWKDDKDKSRQIRSNLSYSLSLEKFDEGPYPSNEWRTSKYTLLNFLPKNLFEQFRRLANFYFLATAILQYIIPFSPVGPATSLLPLLFVVCTSAIKQAYEDYLRHKLDKEVNNRLFYVLRDKKLTKIRSKDIRVGDFVYVRNNEEIPCDMILLATSGHGDKCYITTANLDGETSLKGRTCYQIKEQVGEIGRLDETLLVVECEQPNATLYEFSGYLRAPKDSKAYHILADNLHRPSSTMVGDKNKHFRSKEQQLPELSIVQMIMRRLKLSKSHVSASRNSSNSPHGEMMAAASASVDTSKLGQESGKTVSNSETPFHEITLDISNLLLRASRLRNTTYVYGLAVYTGRDTRLAHNSQVKPNKFSSLESKVNLFLIIAFLLLVSLSLVGALLYKKGDKPRYMKGQADSFAQIFMAHFLLYNYLVPISLYVTLEFVKFLGTIAVVEDEKMKVVAWQSINQATLSKETFVGLQNGHDKQQKVVSEKLDASSISSKKVKVLEGPRCNSSDLNEELGQVEVLFSDKTGTLTENKMRFMACSLYGQLYRQVSGRLYLQPKELYKAPIPNVAKRLSSIESGRHAALAHEYPHASSIKAKSTSQKRSPTASSSSGGSHNSKPFDHRHVPSLDKLKLVDVIEQQERLVEFFICLCLCSTITLNETLPLADCMPDKTFNDYDFQSASPDEESLISAAHQYGVTMCKSNERECYIVIRRGALNGSGHKTPTSPSSAKTKTKTKSKSQSGGPKTKQNQKQVKTPKSGKFKALVESNNSNGNYIVRHFVRLLVFEFNSIRKRMSVFYRDCDNDCVLMVSKGSEEMLDCVKLSNLDDQNENIINITLAHFEAFAMSGLRTLLVARRVVDFDEFKRIEQDMKEARMSIRSREQLMNKLYYKAENELRLIGTTAVEDTLQDGVPETIAGLKEAGIKVWLLTGDKVETAISVAYLCRLLDRDMMLLHLVRQQDVQACQELLESFEQQLNSTKTSDGKMVSTTRVALIADGRSLHYAMKYAKVKLARLCKQCTCVLGCRLSPLQKAEVVDMIKTSDDRPITAAIGDGANDVSMIQEAHVGIGVSGKEGKQAVNCSDFAISRFNMLSRLFFVHGHLFYHRTANTIHYFFYKNLLFILPQFLYSLYNLTQVTSLYHPIFLISFNLFFTSLPILLYGLYEIHIPEEALEKYPKLYRINRKNKLMRLKVFFGWLMMGALQSTIGFYFIHYNWRETPFMEANKVEGLNGFALILYFAIIIIASLKLYLLSNWHTLSFDLALISSCLLLPLFMYVYNLFDWSFMLDDNTFQGRFTPYLIEPLFWGSVCVTCLATLVPNMFYKIWDRVLYFRQINSHIKLNYLPS